MTPQELERRTWLLKRVRELETELAERRVCLVAARDDLARIAAAKTEDGGLWVRAVAEARLPLLDEAISNTDASLAAASRTATGEDAG